MAVAKKSGTTAKSAAAKKAPARPAATHPTWIDMIKECIADHKEDARTGVSRPQIKKYVEEKYKIEMGNAQITQLSKAIISGAEKKVFVLPKGPSGRVKLAPKNARASSPAAKENKPESRTTKPVKPAATKAKASIKAAPKATAKKPVTKEKAKAPAKKAETKAAPAKKAAAKREPVKKAPAKKAAPVKKTTSSSRRDTAKKATTGTSAASKAKTAAAKKAPAKKAAPAKSATSARSARQNVFLGLPLILLPEEVVLLVSKHLAVLVNDPNAHRKPTPQQIEDWNAERKANIKAQVLAAEAKESSTAARTLTEEAVRKRREREEKRLAAARAKAVAEGLNPDSVSPLSRVPPAEMLEQPITPTVGGLLPSGHTVIVPGSSVVSVGWYASDGCVHETIDAARAAGIWSYPSTPSEIAKCAVYQDLWEKGYFMGGGIKFGGDFLVYPGDPLRYHSHFVATVIESPAAPMRPMEIVAHGRLGTATKKSHLLCGYDEEKSEVSYYSIEWAGKLRANSDMQRMAPNVIRTRESYNSVQKACLVSVPTTLGPGLMPTMGPLDSDSSESPSPSSTFSTL
ncbi:hypothetical protein NM688_g4544 [Phlebia brevispora]|uniref:Uncharacterized protein n=1 Tax=Phlebia brevispora TaxID=194682 RepID=A0ACC1T2N1_9APHY|nr:hypothetical protein NM688_g4544 [Phlebia brevispora]